MSEYAWYNAGTEMSSSSFPDWVGVSGSPSSSNKALTGFDGEIANILLFDQDVDDAFGSHSNCTVDPLSLALPSDGTIDWEDILPTTQPLTPVLSEVASWTTDTIDQPLSPVSDGTLVNSPSSSFFSDLKLPMSGDEQVDHPLPSSDFHNGFDFTFQFPVNMSFATSSLFGAVDFPPTGDYDIMWPGYPPMQHTVGAAGAGAPGLMTGVDMNVGLPAFASTTPNLSPFYHPEQSLVDRSESTRLNSSHSGESRMPSSA